MQLELESGNTIDDPSDADIAKFLPTEEYAILSEEPDSEYYLQFAEDEDQPWELSLEYREGSLDAHFRSVDSPISIEHVITAFQKYARGDASWKEAFRWEPMDLPAGPHCEVDFTSPDEDRAESTGVSDDHD